MKHADDGSELRDGTLRVFLELAVPLWIQRIQAEGWTDARIERGAFEAGEFVAERTDVLFRGRKRGEAAGAFNAIALGLACGAHCPGGVKFLGMHFEASEAGWAPEDLEPLPDEELGVSAHG